MSNRPSCVCKRRGRPRATKRFEGSVPQIPAKHVYRSFLPSPIRGSAHVLSQRFCLVGGGGGGTTSSKNILLHRWGDALVFAESCRTFVILPALPALSDLFPMVEALPLLQYIWRRSSRLNTCVVFGTPGPLLTRQCGPHDMTKNLDITTREKRTKSDATAEKEKHRGR